MVNANIRSAVATPVIGPDHPIAGVGVVQTPQDQGNRSPWNWVAILSTLSLLAPVGYLIGFYYESGYLRAYGLTQEIFIRSAQEYIVTSFAPLAVLLEIVAPSLEFSTYKKWLVACMVIGFYTAILILYLKLTDWAVKRFPQANKISQHIKKKSTIVVILSGAILLLVPIMLVYALIFLLLPAIVADSFGGKRALQEIQAFKGCESIHKKSASTMPVPASCISVYDGDKLVVQGKIIAASEKYLALFNGENSMIVPIKPETRIVRPFH